MINILQKNGFSVLKPVLSDFYNFIAFKDNAVLIIILKKNSKITPEEIPIFYKSEIDSFKNYKVPHNFIKEFWVKNKNGYFKLKISNPVSIDFAGVY
jgi:hypothetical protein